MRGFNIKKLAAVGVGAALLGCALAPVVSAAVTGLTKDTIVSSTGVPVVDVVAGSTADVSDWIWAGNIAAKVAQFATETTDITCAGEGGGTCTPSDLSVDMTLGGTTTVTGGKIFKSAMYSDYATAEPALYDQNVTSSNVPSLKYYGNRAYTYNGTSYSTTMQERINFTIDTKFDDLLTVESLVAEITSGNLGYVLDLGSGIPATETSSGTDNFVDDSNDNVMIPMFGEDYLVNGYDTTNAQLELIKSGAEKVYVEGDKITGLTGKDGGTYTLEIGPGGTVGTRQKVQLTLYDSEGTQVGQDYFGTGDVTFYSLGIQILQDVVNIKQIMKQVTGDAELYKPTILVGSDRVLVRHDNGYPYDSSKTAEDYDWTATLVTTSGAGGKIKQIKIKNSAYNKWYSTTALKPGEEAMLLNDYGSAKFLGMQLPEFSGNGVSTTKRVNTYTIGNEKLVYKDRTYEAEHTVPFYYYNENLTDEDSKTFAFDSKTIWFKISSDDLTTATSTRARTDLNIIDAGSGDTLNGVTVQVKYSDTGLTADGCKIYGTNVLDQNVILANQSAVNIGGQQFKVDNNTSFGDGNWASVRADGNITFKKESSTGTVIMENWYYVDNNVSHFQDQESTLAFEGASDVTARYAVMVSTVTTTDPETVRLWLFLDDQTFTGVYGTFLMVGTDTTESFEIVREYYEPDSVLLPADYNGGSGAGEADYAYKVAKFTLTEGTGAGASTDINFFIDTTTSVGDLLIFPNSQLSKYTYEVDYDFNADTDTANWHLREDSPDLYMSSAYTDYGSKISASDHVATMVVPEERAQSEVLVAGTGTTSSVSGGETLTGVTEGSSQTTAGGTKVTVDKINYTSGSCTGGCEPSASTAVVVVPVGELVYSDTAAPAGSHIIVGGHLVNSLAVGLTEADLVAAGDTMVEVTADGDIVVAGYTAADTRTAAQELIDALDALLS